jgi:hypothetical protein
LDAKGEDDDQDCSNATADGLLSWENLLFTVLAKFTIRNNK